MREISFVSLPFFAGRKYERENSEIASKRGRKKKGSTHAHEKKMSNNKSSSAAWASEIESFRKVKNTIVEKSAPTPQRLPLALNSHMGRDYDLISCAPRNNTNVVPEANKAKRNLSPDQIVGKSKEHIERGRDRFFQHSYQAFDAVTHKPVYGLSEADASSKFPAERKRGVRSVGEHHERNFDLISNTALAGRESKFADEKKSLETHHVRYAPRQRQTDIVSHRYKQDHEAREAAQKELTRQKLEARKKETDFNPVLGQFCNRTVEEKKRDEHDKKEAEIRDAVKNHTYKVSNLVRHSEGHAVDYMTGRVHNAEFLLAIEKQGARGRMQRTKLRQEFEHRRDLEEAVREVDVQLVLQRHHPSKKPEFAGGEKPPSTLARLDAAMQSKPAKASDVYLAEGPRTTHERVLNTKPSEVAAAASTYEGRRKLILPTLEKAAGNPLKREELISVLHKSDKHPSQQ